MAHVKWWCTILSDSVCDAFTGAASAPRVQEIRALKTDNTEGRLNISLIKCIVLYFYLTIIYNEFFTYIKTITLKKINLFTVVIITQF